MNDVVPVIATGATAAQGPRASTSATDASAAGGNALPARGANVPAAPVRPAPEPVDMTRVIEQMNRFLQSNQRNLTFHVDESSGRTIITVMNPATGEIVRQIPPEELLAIARKIPDPGALLDAVA